MRLLNSTRSRIFALYALLLAMNAGAWLWALSAFHGYPVLLGTALVAYSLGLRHAVDADHIAAIDNVTRKLMQEGQRPVAVGFLFSLGHSTIVVIGSVAIAASAVALTHRFQLVREMGEIAGTLLSMLFLLGIGVVNLVVLRAIYRVFRRVRAGEPYVEEDLNLLLSGRGLLARILRPLFGMIRSSWQMYPLGILFGLGFDTATEIGVLGISATQASSGLSLWSILVFPALFAAGMSLVDSTDSILMLGAYGWAFARPLRKLYYNMTITLVSALVALGVSGVEALGLLVRHLHLQGVVWAWVTQLNDNFGLLGYLIVGLFVLCWVASIAFYKWRGFEEMEPDGM